MELWKTAALVAGAHVCVLVALVFVIKRILVGDTMKAVARIRQVEAEVRSKEESIRRDIVEHEKEFERQKAEAEETFQAQRQQSERELGQLREQITVEAKKEAERIVENAKKGEEKLRQQIAQDMEEKAVSYGGEVFNLVFSERINEHLNREFIGELLDAIEEVDATSMTVDSADVSFASSHPIDAEQKARLETLLSEKFGAEIKVEEDVKPELMAGLVFKLGSLEIDGSLLSRYNEAVAEVVKGAHAVAPAA
jgi:F0F1-type ATP synthase delta subunit